MRIDIMTLFPDAVDAMMKASIIGRAQERGFVTICTHQIREYTTNKQMQVDDYPYGGGAGMVMQAEPVYQCYESICRSIGNSRPRVVFMTPQGRTFNQQMAEELSREEDLILLCGHYEGIDERVLEKIVTDNVSIGDYVLTGGELPALVVMDTISRLVPGVLNNGMSAVKESFSDNLLEYPQYTRPEEWMGEKVPPVLLSGHHKNIAAWYREQSILRTAKNRPDLLEKAELTEKERQWLIQQLEGEERHHE